jgi:aminobutyraldehyde dehydrogenase
MNRITTIGAAAVPTLQQQTGVTALRAAQALQFGTAWIDCHFIMASEMPHGGSSSPSRQGPVVWSLEEYTNVKRVMARL